MQVQAGSGVQSMGVQTPLLQQDQLSEGVIITGVAMSHVWEVKGIDREERVIIQKLPAPPVVQEHHRHRWETVGRGERCECGMRRQGVRDFLPVTSGKARVYVITPPTGVVVEVPLPLSVYMAMVGGQVKVVTVADLPAPAGQAVVKGWSEAVPLYPQLHRVWSVPEELMGFLGDNLSSAV